MARTDQRTNLIKGTATNDAATAGYIGEYIESVVGATNASGTGVWGDLTSISLTAGDWDITGIFYWHSNGATWTYVQSGISTTSGDSSTGLVAGSNYLVGRWASSSTTPLVVPVAIPNYRISLAASTTVYLKYNSIYSAGTPQALGRLSARRVR